MITNIFWFNIFQSTFFYIAFFYKKKMIIMKWLHKRIEEKNKASALLCLIDYEHPTIGAICQTNILSEEILNTSMTWIHKLNIINQKKFLSLINWLICERNTTQTPRRLDIGGKKCNTDHETALLNCQKEGKGYFHNISVNMAEKCRWMQKIIGFYFYIYSSDHKALNL